MFGYVCVLGFWERHSKLTEEVVHGRYGTCVCAEGNIYKEMMSMSYYGIRGLGEAINRKEEYGIWYVCVLGETHSGKRHGI